jgi:hypothetical protein
MVKCQKITHSTNKNTPKYLYSLQAVVLSGSTCTVGIPRSCQNSSKTSLVSFICGIGTLMANNDLDARTDMLSVKLDII